MQILVRVKDRVFFGKMDKIVRIRVALIVFRSSNSVENSIFDYQSFPSRRHHDRTSLQGWSGVRLNVAGSVGWFVSVTEADLFWCRPLLGQ